MSIDFAVQSEKLRRKRGAFVEDVALAIEPVRGDEVLAQGNAFAVVGKRDPDSRRRRVMPGERDGEC